MKANIIQKKGFNLWKNISWFQGLKPNTQLPNNLHLNPTKLTTQQLIEQIKLKKSFLAVGLDVDLDKIPKHLLELRPILNSTKR
jgi:hypothetical protein